ncbi:sensor histidine kinase [Lysobacter soli]|uniref:sensor histidine kinase n=1 Tax=Lysobacter soli TaxID=453783 RepID=UPI0036A98B75
MMHRFLIANRDELAARCRVKVQARSAYGVPGAELEHGISVFLEQVIKTLELEQTADPLQSRRVSGRAGGGKPALSEIGDTAARHGKELMQHGFTVEEVVHDYGDLCQAITDLAFELDAQIEVEEFRILNRCLDNAIANAVTEFGYQRDIVVADQHVHDLNARLGSLAHELRNQLATATLALSAIRNGSVGVTGATGGILERSLVNLGNLIDRSLAEVRMTAGLPLQSRLFSVHEFLAELRLSASLEADIRGFTLKVSNVDPSLAVDVDRDLLLAAAGNLLQNAFKFSHPHTEITVNAYAVADRILIDVEDRCGGLPSGDAEKMFLPFTQHAQDRSGLGLGLSISRRSIEANAGLLSVRNVPGTGCVFTIDLPRHSLGDEPTEFAGP